MHPFAPARLILIFSIITLFSLNKADAVTCSTDICTIATGTTVDVSRHSLCTSVTNTKGVSIMVPTKTAPELQSFISTGPIAGIAQGACVTVPPTVVSSSNYNAGGAPTVSINKPPGIAVGDLVVILIYDSSTLATVIPPSGFALSGVIGPTQCGAYRSALYFKVVDAADVAGSNFTFSKSSGSFTSSGLMSVAFRGVNQTTPIAAHSASNSASGTTATFPTLTATTANSLSVGISESCNSGSHSIPTGYSSAADFVSGYYTQFTMKAVTAGATGTFTSTIPSGGWIATHFIVNPL